MAELKSEFSAEEASRWWQTVSSLMDKSPLHAIDEIKTNGKKIIPVLKSSGGYPWLMTFRTIVSAYSSSGDYKGLLNFVADHFNNKELPGENKSLTLENALTYIVNMALRANDIAKADNTLLFMMSDEVLQQISTEFINGYRSHVERLQIEREIKAGNYDGPIAFFTRQNAKFEEAYNYLKLAVVYLLKGDEDMVIENIRKGYLLDLSKRKDVESGYLFSELKDFISGEVYKSEFPAQNLPEDEALQNAYERADNHPYSVYKNLEEEKMLCADLIDLLGIQLYCISEICSDLDEHGEFNLYLYGNGEVSMDDFNSLKKSLYEELKQQMNIEGRVEVPFWKYIGWIYKWKNKEIIK